MDKIPACKDCRHVRPANEFLVLGVLASCTVLLLPAVYWILKERWEFAKCVHPSLKYTSTKNAYKGSSKDYYFYCSTNREFECGKLGKYFEPRSGTNLQIEMPSVARFWDWFTGRGD